MKTLHFAIPGDLDTPTGGYSYDRNVLALLPSCGLDARLLTLPGGFPFPSEAEIAETAEALAAIPAGDALLIDGLAFGAMPVDLLKRVAAPMTVLLHHPLGLETGLDAATAGRLLAMERDALTAARAVIVSSTTTAATLAGLGFAPPPPVTVALPGTERASRATGSDGPSVAILSIGSLIPRKGYDVLVEALGRLAHLDWHATIAGSAVLDPPCAAAIMAQIAGSGVANRFTLAGVQDAAGLGGLYAAADIYALPSRYEGYGMAFAGALARGLPVVAARAGAVPEVLPPDASILVPPDDADALSDALARLITDGALRRRMGDAAWVHGQTLPRWEDTAAIIAGAVRSAVA